MYNFLVIHVRQPQCKDKNLEETVFYLQHMEINGKEKHNKKHNIQEKLAIRKMVLLYNT